MAPIQENLLYPYTDVGVLALKTDMAAWTWKDSDDLCALADGERYLAHVIELAGRWLAFDATHLNESGRGFAFLGARDYLSEAKELAERALRGELASVAVHPPPPAGAAPEPLPRLAAELEDAALHLEWACLQKEWRKAQGLVRKLVTSLESAQLAAPEPERWIPLAAAGRELGRTVLRRNNSEIQIALTRYRDALEHLRRPGSARPVY